jgi:hypothetical protein
MPAGYGIVLTQIKASARWVMLLRSEIDDAEAITAAGGSEP